MKAVIGFVTNDEECRSVQLLRYFNEKAKETCGRCDVCLKQGGNRVPYDVIETKVKSVMSESFQSMQDVLAQCKEFDEAQVLDSIRYLLDNGVLQMETNGAVRKKSNKKSRL